MSWFDTGRLYAELRARGFAHAVAIRSVTYVVELLTRPAAPAPN